MSYSIQTTEGLILSYKPLREADRVYSILTRDLGLIRATAIGVRKDSSKLRGALEPVCLSSISLVRGKEYWRVTSADVLERVPSVSEVMRPLALLEKLVQGEAHSSELFDAIREIIARFDLAESIDEMFEIHLVATILFHLGYLKEPDLKLPKKDLIMAINHGLEMSHLTTR